MAYKTYGDLISFVQNKLDLRDEDFVDAPELLQYCEEAIKHCEAEIHTLNVTDWYFETSAAIRLVNGISSYPLPSNIYGQKITRLVFNDGGDIYDVKRNIRVQRYGEQKVVKDFGTSSFYTYLMYNNHAITGPNVELAPKSRDTSIVVSLTGDLTLGSKVIANASTTTGLVEGYYVEGASLASGTWIESIDAGASTITLNQPAIATSTTESLEAVEPLLTCYYIRSAQIPTVSTDLIDFPEFWNFISQHMIVEVLKKELGNPRVTEENVKLQKLEMQLHATLADKTPDQTDDVQMDTSFYNDMDLGDY